MNGMEMMMKSVLGAAGFDAEKFKGDVEKGLADARAKYEEIKAQQNRIEEKLDTLLRLNGMEDGPSLHLVETSYQKARGTQDG
jgi:hypothetical protein